MVTIKGTDYNPKITNSVLLRYAAHVKIGVSTLITLLGDITPDHLVGVFVFAAKLQGDTLTEADVWEELDNRFEVFGELANHLTNQLSPAIPESEQKKSGKKGTAK